MTCMEHENQRYAKGMAALSGGGKKKGAEPKGGHWERKPQGGGEGGGGGGLWSSVQNGVRGIGGREQRAKWVGPVAQGWQQR